MCEMIPTRMRSNAVEGGGDTSLAWDDAVMILHNISLVGRWLGRLPAGRPRLSAGRPSPPAALVAPGLHCRPGHPTGAGPPGDTRPEDRDQRPRAYAVGLFQRRRRFCCRHVAINSERDPGKHWRRIQGPYTETIDLWIEPFFAKEIRRVIEWLREIKTADQHCFQFLLIQQNKFFKLNVN